MTILSLSSHHMTSHDLTLSLRQASSVHCVPRTLKTSTLPRYWGERGREGEREGRREGDVKRKDFSTTNLASVNSTICTYSLSGESVSAYLCMVANCLTNESIVRVLPALWGKGALTVAMATHISLGLTGSAHWNTSRVLSVYCLLYDTRQIYIIVRGTLTVSFTMHNGYLWEGLNDFLILLFNVHRQMGCGQICEHCIS